MIPRQRIRSFLKFATILFVGYWMGHWICKAEYHGKIASSYEYISALEKANTYLMSDGQEGKFNATVLNSYRERFYLYNPQFATDSFTYVPNHGYLRTSMSW